MDDLVKKLETILRDTLEVQVRPNDPKDVPGISADSITAAAEAIAALRSGGEQEELAKDCERQAAFARKQHADLSNADLECLSSVHLEIAEKYERIAALLRAPVAVTVDELAELKEALDSRCLYINPKILRTIADEIDCDGQCESIWREWDTNASGCHKSERGEYCPNDLAETLRAVAKVAEKFAALAAEVG